MRVLLFASAREAAGGRPVLHLPRGSSPPRLGELLDALGKDHPRLTAVFRSCRIAVNGEYLPTMDRAYRLRPGDEVAILPPYSGG